MLYQCYNNHATAFALGLHFPAFTLSETEYWSARLRKVSVGAAPRADNAHFLSTFSSKVSYKCTIALNSA